jgi:hypothetical protein
MARDKDVINTIVTQALDTAKELSVDKQINVLTALSQLDPSVLQSEAFVTWAKQSEIQQRLEAFGIKVKLFEGHAVALGKGGDKLTEATSRAATLHDLFSSLGMAMDCTIKSGKIDGASVAIQLTVK